MPEEYRFDVTIVGNPQLEKWDLQNGPELARMLLKKVGDDCDDVELELLADPPEGFTAAQIRYGKKTAFLAIYHTDPKGIVYVFKASGAEPSITWSSATPHTAITVGTVGLLEHSVTIGYLFSAPTTGMGLP